MRRVARSVVLWCLVVPIVFVLAFASEAAAVRAFDWMTRGRS